MKNKRFNIQFKLPQLSASHYLQFASVEQPTLERALKEAWRKVKTRPAVKGKRIKEGVISFTIEE